MEAPLLVAKTVAGAYTRRRWGVTQVVRDRCNKFLNGEWESLYGSVVVAGQRSTAVQSEHRIVTEVLKLVKAGELSRAAQRLDASQIAPANHDTLELLQRLHPVGDGMPHFPADEIGTFHGSSAYP